MTEPSGNNRWIVVDDEILKGQGLAPYVEGEIAVLFDWVENPQAGSKHFMPHRGQFIVDVVEIDANAVHQPSKPGDEVVVVLSGALSLTTDATGTEQVIHAGEMVLIPAGWAGIYRVLPADDAAFRELAIVPGDYFDPGVAPAPNRQSPRRIDLPLASGRHSLFRNRYLLEARNMDRAVREPVSAPADQIILVQSGVLTLSADGATQAFEAGSVVILPRGFEGTAALSADYRAVNLQWLG